MYIVNFTFLFLWLHSLGNKPLNKWSSHHLYPGLTCNLTVLVLIKVHLQPPASSNVLASLPALLEIHPKKRANSEKKKVSTNHLVNWLHYQMLHVYPWSGVWLPLGERKTTWQISVSDTIKSLISASASNWNVMVRTFFEDFSSLS